MNKILLTVSLLTISLQINAQPTHLYNKYWDADTPGLFFTLPDEFLGSSFASGDFNGDGYNDLAIGEPGVSGDTGDVLILYGTSTGISSLNNVYISQIDPESDDRFGETLAVGDINGDGYDDLVVGAPEEDFGTIEDVGGISVFYGSISGLPLTADEEVIGSIQAFANFSFSLAVGDFDGDGYDEIAVGAPFEDIVVGPTTYSDAGKLVIYPGSSTGVVFGSAQLINQNNGAAGFPENDDLFGYSLAAGNFNSDGEISPNFYIDLAVGVPGEAFNTAVFDGIVQAFYGSVTGLGSDVIITQNDINGATPEAGDFFGYSLAAGNVFGAFGEFSDDLIIGVPLETVGSLTEAGVVHVMPGSVSGLASTGSYTLSQNTSGFAGIAETGDRFGESVAVVDLAESLFYENRSIIIGVSHEDFQAVDDGVVHIVSQSDISSVTSMLVSAPSPNDNAHFGAAVGSVYTDFGSGYGFPTVMVGIPRQTSADNDLNSGAFLEVVFAGNDIIFKHGFD